MQQYSPPAVFATVEPKVYRTNSLYPINFPFIKMLGLKTVIQLSPEVPIKAVTQFLEENNINFIHLGLKAWKPDASWKPITEELIKEALEIVLDVKSHPVMVTCTTGVHQTGVLVGCLRRLQNWSLASILVEYRMYAQQSNTRYVNEVFIELFDVDLVTLPPNLPTWFVDQRQMMAEEEDEALRRKELQQSQQEQNQQQQ
jgi:tyrosine-protein phosphatase SIW14